MSTPESKLPEEAPSGTGTEPQEAGVSLPAGATEFAGETLAAQVAAGPSVPEDLRAPWTWLDLLIFLLFSFGSLLVLTNVLARIAADIWRMTPSQVQKFAATNAGFVTLRQALWFATLMVYLFAAIRVRLGTPFWRTIGWRELRLGSLSRRGAVLLCVLGGIVLAIVVQYASVFIGKPHALPIEAFFQDRRSVLLVMSVGVLVAPLVEETVFRGYIYPVVARSFGVPLGVVFTGALFGLLHAPQLWGGWGQVALLVTVGIVFTGVRARTGTVVATYFLHLGYNVFLFLAFFFATGGLRYFPSN
jgi:hypothetical protein